MGRKPKLKVNIVSAWNWFTNIIDTNNLSSSEQLTLVHIMKFLNRNYWLPVNISLTALSKSIGKDYRTTSIAFSSLVKKNIVLQTDDGLYINISNDFTNAVNANSQSLMEQSNLKRLNWLASQQRLSGLDEVDYNRPSKQKQLQKMVTTDILRRQIH